MEHAIWGPYRPTSETPFEWRFACGPIVACFYLITECVYVSSVATLSRNLHASGNLKRSVLGVCLRVLIVCMCVHALCVSECAFGYVRCPKGIISHFRLQGTKIFQYCNCTCLQDK